LEKIQTITKVLED